MANDLTRFLRVEFSEAQLLVLAMQLVHKLREISDTEDRFDSVKADFAKELKDLRIASNHLVRKITDRCEYLDVHCKALPHDPRQGQKTIVRLDTGEIAAIEDMTEAELQDKLPLDMPIDAPGSAETSGTTVSIGVKENGKFEYSEPIPVEQFDQRLKEVGKHLAKSGKKPKAKSATNGDPG